MYAYLLFSVQESAIETPIRRFLAVHAGRLIPASFHQEAQIIRYGKFVLAVWHPRTLSRAFSELLNPGPIIHPEKGLFFASGYLAEGMVNNNYHESGAACQGVFRLISEQQNTMRLASSLGGVSSCTYIDSSGENAYCWSTQPPATPTFYSSNPDVGISVAGNRPRLVHCASRLANSAILRNDYLPEYICSGFAVSGHTIYEGTHAIPPNKSLSLGRSGAKIVPYPLAAAEPIEQTYPLVEKGSLLAQLLADACSPAKTTKECTVWLSGGKDSRAIACALSGLEADVDAFTFGLADEREASAAATVASAVGWNHEILPQLIISDPLRAAAHCNVATDGLGIPFAHQYNFDFDVSFSSRRPSLHGHGHLLRGGFARTMMRDARLLVATMHNSFCSPLCNTETQNLICNLLAEWEAERKGFFKEYRELLYYSNLDFRLGLFTAPSTLDLTAKAFMVYPLLDERVAIFASRLYMFDKVSERVLFSALTSLCPDLAELPLYGEGWRFDRFSPGAKYLDSDTNFEAGFQNRRPREAQKALDANHNGLRHDLPHLNARASRQQIAAYILDSSIRDKLPEILSAEFLQDLYSIAASGQIGKGSIDSLSAEEFVRLQMVNRVFVASTLYDLRWQ